MTKQEFIEAFADRAAAQKMFHEQIVRMATAHAEERGVNSSDTPRPPSNVASGVTELEADHRFIDKNAN
jgi:hypothetical protein